MHSYLTENLPLAKFTIPESTYLAWIDISEYFDENENLTKFFLDKAGVIVEGGEMFVSKNNGIIRLNLAHPKDTVVEGISKISEAIKKTDCNKNS